MRKISKEDLVWIFDVINIYIRTDFASFYRVVSLIDYDFDTPGILRINVNTFGHNYGQLCFAQNNIYLSVTNSGIDNYLLSRVNGKLAVLANEIGYC